MPATPRRHPILPRGALLLPLLMPTLLSGCYAYRATPPAALVDGAEVRLQLTPEGATSLMNDAGMRLGSIEGRVQSRRADGALVVMPTGVVTADGDALPWRRGALTVPVQSLGGSERRSVNRRRSVAVAAGIAGAFAAVVLIGFRSIWGGGGSSTSPGGGTPE